MKKILWLGPIVDPEKQTLTNAISPAANTWQLEFIKGLIDNSISVTILTYMPDQVWPKGKIWIKYPSNETLNNKVENINVGYLNLYLIRDVWIPCALFIKTVFKTNLKKTNFFFSYNVPFRHRLFAIFIKFFSPHIKWLSIIADIGSKGNPDYHIFLSYDYFKKFPNNKKIFLDGGIPIINDDIATKVETQQKVLLYAGSISEWTGIEDFCSLFDSISSQLDIELHIYGKGKSVQLNSLVERNPKIKFFGFVSDSELHLACQNAYAFINPRPLDAHQGENNFPSKLLMYLAYKKPILSTKTPNLSPSYDLLLNYYYGIDSLKAELQSIIRSKELYQLKKNSISKYTKQNSWKEKIKLLLRSLEY